MIPVKAGTAPVAPESGVLRPRMARRGAARGGLTRAALALLVAAMAWCGFGLGNSAQAAIGELIVLKGEVSLIRGRIKARVLERFELEDGDRVVTARGAKALIRLRGELEGDEAIVTENTDFKVNELLPRRKVSPIQLVFGAIRSRIVKFGNPEPFMSTPAAIIGIKGTDFIAYVKRREATEFIGVEGLIEAASRSRPEFSIQIGKRQWGEIVEGERPRPPIPVPDELWFPALEEFRFPTPEELQAAERRGR
jgi:hypothetical protein